MFKKSVLAVSMLIALFAMSGLALADSIVYSISLGEGTLGGLTGPYATATVNRTSTTTATLTFDSLTTNGITFLMGGTSAADINVNASSWGVSSLTGTVLSGFSNGALTAAPGGNVSSFGVFNTTINNFDGYTNSHNQITFLVTNLSGTWATAANVLTPNASGYSVAIHGFACTSPCATTAGAVTTGFAVNGAVPEPASLMLLGAGLAGIGILRRKSAKI